MNGGLTHYELAEIRWKARRYDAVIAWLDGRTDHERLIQVADILAGNGKDPRPERPDLKREIKARCSRCGK